MSVENNQRIYFKNLDILRFIAAYMIVLLHCFFGWKERYGYPLFMLNGTGEANFIGKLADRVLHNFSFGVDIFFIISGFLITYLLLAEHEKTGKVDIVKFYIRRAFRIWPLYFLMILIGPLMTYFFREDSPNYLMQFFFLGNFDLMINGIKSIATNHLWSICIEEHFYLFCPLLVGFIPVKRLPQVLISIMFICIIFRGYVVENMQDYGNLLYVHTLSRIDILALGSLFGYLYFHKRLVFNDPLPIRLLVYTVFIFIFINDDYNRHDTVFEAGIKKYFYVLLASYWAGNFLFNPKAKFAVTKPNVFHHLGKLTYGLYMFNPVIIFITLEFCKAYSLQNFLLFFIMAHALIYMVTRLSFKYIEMPFLDLKEKYSVVESGSGNKIKTVEKSVSISEQPALKPIEISHNQKI